jgi:hypothetical protein
VIQSADAGGGSHPDRHAGARTVVTRHGVRDRQVTRVQYGLQIPHAEVEPTCVLPGAADASVHELTSTLPEISRSPHKGG